jgi:hypothetical protein
MEDAKMDAIVAKVRKLLAMAEGNANEHEAAVAATKAQELLEAYNLDMTIIGKATNTFAPRQNQYREGGLYKWQRNLWYAVANLNFCRYWYLKGNTAGSVYQHQVLGSHVNVVGTEVMAQYLEQTIERLARNWVHENRPGKSVFIKEAIAFREGVATRLCNRLWAARYEHEEAEREKAKAERERNAANGIFTENAIVIQDVVNTEEDLNTDYMNGWEPGTAAAQRKVREAKQAAFEREAAEEARRQAEWDELHPAEAAARKKAEAEQADADTKAYWGKQEKRRPRAKTAEEKRRELYSFREGYAKGAEVSLNRQVDEQAKRRLNG